MKRSVKSHQEHAQTCRQRSVVSGLAVAVALSLTALLGGCSAPAPQRPLIVVTTNILGDVVTEIAGDQAEVVTLMQPNADPHSFEISAQQAAHMQNADLLVSNGLHLEEGLQQHLDVAVQAGVTNFVAGDVIETINYSSEASGTTKPTPDPHWWTDPAQMITVARDLGAAVAAIDGVDAHEVAATSAGYLSKLGELDRDMQESFAAIDPAQRKLVTNHHVFGYLAKRFDFEIVGAVIPGGSTLAAPSASDLREIVEAIEAAQVSTIFAESSQPDRLMQLLASEAQLHVNVVPLFTESLTEKSGEAGSYLDMMRANTARIFTGLAQPTAAGAGHNK